MTNFPAPTFIGVFFTFHIKDKKMKVLLSGIVCFSLVFSSVAYAGNFIADLGDVISFKVLPVYSFAATVYNSDWNTWYDYDWNGLKQLIVVNLIKSTVTDTLKENISEQRPNKLGFDSFPSGHTANAFANAAFIHRRYGIRQAIVPYVLASFVGYSRVQSRWHYTHDVLAGAAVGFLSAWIFADKKQNVFIAADTESVAFRFSTVF